MNFTMIPVAKPLANGLLFAVSLLSADSYLKFDLVNLVILFRLGSVPRFS